MIISLKAGSSSTRGSETGARQSPQLLCKARGAGRAAEGMGPAPLCAVSKFSYFHLNEQLHLAESLEGKKEATDTL